MKIAEMNKPLHSTLTDAIQEAERFIKKAELARERLINDEYAWAGTKETAAAKRASMDLTRELVNVRR
jgi:hypothetical protein